MLKRLYLDNFRCYSNFELSPGGIELFVGPNGAGKSGIFEALFLLKQTILSGRPVGDFFTYFSKTRWDDREKQTFELEFSEPEKTFIYRLELAQFSSSEPVKILRELVREDDETLFEVHGGNASFLLASGKLSEPLPVDPTKSLLSFLDSAGSRLSKFLDHVRGLWCLKINPWTMYSVSRSPENALNADCSNYASWLDFLLRDDPVGIVNGLVPELKNVLSDFESFRFISAGDGSSALCYMLRTESKATKQWMAIHELSEGQRVLIVLYTIMHALQSPNLTLCIDEPDNFVALSELQPWIMLLTDRIEHTGGQSLIVSHHPELINYFALDHAIQFFRDPCGPARHKRLQLPADGPLKASELIARGWEDE